MSGRAVAVTAAVIASGVGAWLFVVTGRVIVPSRWGRRRAPGVGSVSAR